MQGGGVLHLRLDDVVGEPRYRERRSRASRNGATLNRVAVGNGQRQQLVVEFDVRKLEFGDRPHREQRIFERAAQHLGERPELR